MFVKLLKKYGIFKTHVIVIFLTDVCSGSMAYIFMTIFRGYVTHLEIIAAVLLPTVIAPFFMYSMSKNFLRIHEIEVELQKKNDDLVKALNEISQLGGLLPICSSCKMIRDDQGYWKQIEAYISEHSEAKFSHGLCPDCAKKLYSME